MDAAWLDALDASAGGTSRALPYVKGDTSTTSKVCVCQGKIRTYPFRLPWPVRSSSTADGRRVVGRVAGTGLRGDCFGRIMLGSSHVSATGVWREMLLGICIVHANRSDMRGAWLMLT